MGLWLWIETHPTISTGALGFAGVIGTMLFNAWQVRRQRAEELRHERQSLRAALIEELQIVLNAHQKNVELSKKGGKQDETWVSLNQMDDAYRIALNRLGVLNQDEVSKVMYAYLSRRAYFDNVHILGPESPSGRHVVIPPHGYGTLVGMQEGMVEPLQDAISLMQKRQAEEHR